EYPPSSSSCAQKIRMDLGKGFTPSSSALEASISPDEPLSSTTARYRPAAEGKVNVTAALWGEPAGLRSVDSRSVCCASSALCGLSRRACTETPRQGVELGLRNEK